MAAVCVQVALIVNGYRDPHNTFAFQPFNESSTYELELVRITADGERIPEPDGAWAGYEWNELVGTPALQNPWSQRHAVNGVDAVLDFVDGALDWIAANTPADTETLRLEATVTYRRNAGPPTEIVLRSDERPAAR